MSKVLFQRIVSLHAASSELAKTIRLERLVDTGEAESRSLAARGTYRAVERRLLTLSRFFSLGRGEVSDESQGALPGLWEYGKYYPRRKLHWHPASLTTSLLGFPVCFRPKTASLKPDSPRGISPARRFPPPSAAA